MSGVPVSGVPVSGVPVSGASMSGASVTAASVTGASMPVRVPGVAWSGIGEPCAGLTLLVLAKAPVPGLSKTRLVPGYGPQGAASLAAAALADTLAAVAATAAARRVLVFAGEPVPDLPPGFEVIPQVFGCHAARIAAAFESADGPALLIGMDTPQVTPDLLALDLSDGHVGAWLGLACDGGWWALGLREPRRYARRVLDGVPMSTPVTGALQRRRLLRAGLLVADLPVLRDVDEPPDVGPVAEVAPGTRFARAAAALEGAA